MISNPTWLNLGIGLLASSLLIACSRSSPAPVVYKGSKPNAVSTTGDRTRGQISVVRSQSIKLPRVESRILAAVKNRPAVAVVGPTGWHVVGTGETLYAVAKRNKLSLRALIEANDLSPPYYLTRGQRLRLPIPRWHQVAPGDTLYSISQTYSVGLRDLVLVNRLQPPYGLRPGDRLRVPFAASTGRKTKEPVSALPKIASRLKISAGRGRFKMIAGIAVPAFKPYRAGLLGQARVYGKSSTAKPPPRAGRRFAWPVIGRLASRFGWKPGGRRNDGINIYARYGAPVFAAENGVVAYAGNELKGFGNLLLLRHAGGWMTAYAHNGKIVVRPGQRVRRGQVVARVGRSGSVNRPQLHFEVRNGRRVLNPLLYLERRKSTDRYSPAAKARNS